MSAIRPYELIDDGEAGVRRLVEAFYDAMEREPEYAALRAIHVQDLAPMRARLADFLTQWLGGPRVWAERHPGRGCIVSAHAPFPINAELADEWMACMRRAFAAARVGAPFREMVEPVLAQMCQGLRNDRG